MDEGSGLYTQALTFKIIGDFMILNTDQVMQILPHRDPFLFIDSVESVTIPGRTLAPGEIVDIKTFKMPKSSHTIALKKITIFSKGIFLITQFFRELFRWK